MPKPVHYQANSIIYFTGDSSDSVYVLSSGRVSINSIDLETGQENRQLIKTGEFFGVRSALGRYLRDETAIVLSPSTAIVFSINEFESLVSKNSRVMLQMLKIFSNQLRKINKHVENLLDRDEGIDPEQGLFDCAEYYLKANKYSQALYVLKQYILHFPDKKNAELVSKNIGICEENIEKHSTDVMSESKESNTDNEEDDFELDDKVEVELEEE